MEIIVILRLMAYIAAVSLQLAAAILLIRNVDTNPDAVIKSVLSSGKKVTMVTKDGKILDKDSIAMEAETVFQNKTAFYMLFLGYFIGVFGRTVDGLELYIILAACITTIVLFISVLKITRKLSHSIKYLEYDINSIVVPKGAVVMEMETEEMNNGEV